MHEDVTLPMTDCLVCAEKTLTFAQMDDGTLVRRCVHCDTLAAAIEWREPFDVVESGYRIDGVVDPNAKRGCRGGACGIRQPEV